MDIRDSLQKMRDHRDDIIRFKNKPQQNIDTKKNISVRDTLNIMRKLQESKHNLINEDETSNDEDIEVIDATASHNEVKSETIFNQAALEKQFKDYFNDNDIFYEIQFGQIQQSSDTPPKIDWKGVFIIDDGSEPNSIAKEIRWTFKIPQINEGYDIRYIGLSAPNETTGQEMNQIQSSPTGTNDSENVNKITDGIKHLYKLFNENYILKTENK